MICRMYLCLALFAALLAPVGLSGCKDGAKKTDPTTPAKKTEAAHDHPTEGPHGGKLVEWGEDVFHVEFTVDPATKTATIYILDDKAKPSSKIEAAKISKVKVRVTNAKPAITVEMKHDPKKSSDKDGVAFVGTHDRFGEAGEIHGTIDGVIEGNPPFSGDLKYKAGEKKK